MQQFFHKKYFSLNMIWDLSLKGMMYFSNMKIWSFYPYLALLSDSDYLMVLIYNP